MFPDAPSISPYLELPGAGPTSQFCAEVSKRLQCYVVAGYPEALGKDESRGTIIMENYEHEEVGANSAVLYGPDGTLLGNYRKTNPFETDMTWAKPGTSSYPVPISVLWLTWKSRYWICDLPPSPSHTCDGNGNLHGS